MGLSREGEPLWETTWRSERNHTVELAPAVEALLDRAGAAPGDLRAVFVALGPGGFSALRVGMSVAKAMAEALDIPLLGVGTLEIEAFPYASTGLPLCPMLEVGRGEVAWALFQDSGGDWHRLREEEIAAPEKVVSTAPPGTLFCGEAAWTVGDLLHGSASEEVTVIAAPPPTRRASSLARLGFRRLSHGLADDRATLQPLYLRRPSITMPKVKRGAVKR